jgi:hypothetical protein
MTKLNWQQTSRQTQLSRQQIVNTPINSQNNSRTLNIPNRTFPNHIGHSIIITKTKPGSVHAGAYRCIECNKHLAWATKDEVKYRG